jgi:hypothetical protein
MFSEKTVKTPRRWNNWGVVMCLLLFMIGALPVVRAQERPSTPQDIQVRRKAELHTRGKGKVIAEGRNTNASKHVPVTRFTVEELQLDEPIEAEIAGKKTEVYQAYRITVFGGPFTTRAMPLTLMINDKTTLIGVESPKLDKATFIFYDRSLLLEGPTLTVGYGAVNIELTDKLSLGETPK